MPRARFYQYNAGAPFSKIGHQHYAAIPYFISVFSGNNKYPVPVACPVA
jgi:hypothetical protein